MFRVKNRKKRIGAVFVGLMLIGLIAWVVSYRAGPDNVGYDDKPSSDLANDRDKIGRDVLDGRFDASVVERASSLAQSEGTESAVFDEGSLNGVDDRGSLKLGFGVEKEIVIEESTDGHRHVLKEWLGSFEPAVDGNFLEGNPNGLVEFTAPDGTLLILEIGNHKRFSGDRGIYMGRLEGEAFSRVVLSYVSGAVSGSIKNVVTEYALEFRNAGGGKQYVSQIDLSALGECLRCKEQIAESEGAKN